MGNVGSPATNVTPYLCDYSHDFIATHNPHHVHKIIGVKLMNLWIVEEVKVYTVDYKLFPGLGIVEDTQPGLWVRNKLELTVDHFDGRIG